ncbi:MAG: FeoB-associated Cys-rich membrane protein [Oscillospiraceae bacterium]|nr:FeoB-associated Cys-rich membrane protein [Oscillospiraceae bacterium]
MVTWLAENLGTILVTIFLIVIVTSIIRKMVKDKKQGKTTCSCNCSTCAMCQYCHKKPTTTN